MILNRVFSLKTIALAATLSLVSFSSCTKKSETPSTAEGQGSAQTSGPTGDTIKVGEIGSMTGNDATFGISTHNGIELAFKQINAAGGVKGKKLALVSYDNRGTGDETATAMTKLITQDKVIAVLGEVASGRSSVMAPIAQRYKVPMISPSSTNPKVTQVGDYIFRVCFIDPFQGKVMAKFAHDVLKAKRVAVLRDVGNEYSVGLANFFVDTFKGLGGQIVLDQSYSEQDVDFKSQLTAIRAQKPDAIFVPGYYTQVGLIARQARELGLNVPLLGGDGWDSPKLTEIGGKAMNNTYFSNHYTAESKDAAVQDFIAEYKKAYGSVPDGLAAMGYDAAKILADAMNRAKSLSGEDIRDAIAATKDYPAVTGKITMDKDRNPVKAAVVIQVQDGALKYHSTVNP